MDDNDTKYTYYSNNGFFTDGSFSDSINETVIWSIYTIINETISLQSGVETQILEYSFSNNDNTLTFIELDGEET